MRSVGTSIALGVVLAAALIAGALAALAPRTPVDGAFDAAAAAVRAAAFGKADFSDAGVVVVLLDERSLDAEALRGTPRAMMSPVWAELSETAFGHGAEAVAFDFILAFDAGDLRIGEERPLKRYDAPFLGLLRKEGRAGRLLIGRSKDLVPARRFAAVAGAAGLAYVDVDPEVDGVVRSMRLAHSLAEGGTARTMAGALLGREEPRTVPIVPPAPLAALPAVSAIDVLACGDAAALGKLFSGRRVLVGSGLPGEDRMRAPDRFMPHPPAGAAGAAPCDFARPPIGDEGGGVPGVFLHAAAVDAVLSGWALTPVSPPGPAGSPSWTAAPGCSAEASPVMWRLRSSNGSWRRSACRNWRASAGISP